jgi:hypothetical protein
VTLTHRTRAAFIVSTLAAVAGLLVVPSTTAAAGAASPPSCANLSKNTNCVHAPTSDITALAAPSVKDTYKASKRERVLQFSATLTPPYQTCPDGGVPFGDIPCTFRGLSVGARVYMPDGGPAVNVGGDGPGSSTPPGDCAYFVCQHVKITMPYDYYGPSTVILHYGVGDLIDGPNGPGALSSSDYENTIKVPADPTSHAIYLLKGKKVLTTKSRTQTLNLAGKGGVPRHGVGGVVVFIDGKGYGEIRRGDYFGNTSGVLEVIKGTSLRLVKQLDSKGTYSVVPVAYYSTKTGMSGNLVHRTPAQKQVHVARKMSLRKAGVPADATAAILQVQSPHKDFVLGGVRVLKIDDMQYVMARISRGAILHTNAPRGAKVIVEGYTEPIHAIDDGSTLKPQFTEELWNAVGLPPVN